MSEISVEFSQKCSASSASTSRNFTRSTKKRRKITEKNRINRYFFVDSNAGAIGGGVAAAVVVITLVALAIIFGPKLCGEKGDNIDVARYGS